jgi:regulatory protein
MQIIKFKKVGKCKYKLCFENTELILHENLILKYNLLSKKELNTKQIEILLKENTFYDAYETALRLLSIKLRTKKEMQTLLEKKNFDKNIINNVIDKIIEEGYINDKKYIEIYINDKINLSNDGPYKIKMTLIKNDLDEDYIDKILFKIDNKVWEDKITKIIQKKYKSNKNSIYIFKNKIVNYLITLGYDKNNIYEILNNLKFNDEDNLKKEIEKAKKKYSKKYSDEKLDYMIKKYLYSKGFSYDKVSDNYED